MVPLELSSRNSSGLGGEESIVENGMAKAPSGWSRDGRWLLYSETAKSGKTSLWMAGLTGASKPERLLPEDFESRHGQFSPDVHWVAYAAAESPLQQIYVQSFLPGAENGRSRMMGEANPGGAATAKNCSISIHSAR